MMKLYWAPTSPFVRKVMVVAIETGQAGEIETVFSAAHPINRDPAVVADNPLGKIPTLDTGEGLSLFDSRVICEYLDARAGGGAVLPVAGRARWQALARQALADGLLDAAILARYERLMRPEELQYPVWREAQLAKIHASLAAMEAEAQTLPQDGNIGAISTGCALGYLDFRYPELDWRARAPDLARWFAAYDERPAMRETRPRDMQ